MSTDDAGSEVAKRSEGKTGPQPALRASDAERDAMITALRDAAAEGAWRVGDRPLGIERDPDPVQSDRLVMLHHEGDLLTRAATARDSRFRLLRRSFFVHTRTDTVPRIGRSRLR